MAEYVEYIERRFFLDLWHSCAFRCNYCYVENEQMPAVSSGDKIDQCVASLLSHPAFEAGRHGSLLSFSPHSEAWNTASRSREILSLMARLAPYGNPMHFATKSCLGRDVVSAISEMRQYRAQIVPYVSMSTISQGAKYEEGAPDPADRLENFRLFTEFDVPSCLFIKPVIPGVSIADAYLFVEAIRKYSVAVVCIGVLYADDEIRSNLGIVAPSDPASNLRMPGHSGTCLTVISNAGEFEQLAQILSDSTGAKVFKSAPCVMAWHQDTYSPTLTWRRFPQLCIECKNCEEIYTLTLHRHAP